MNFTTFQLVDEKWHRSEVSFKVGVYSESEVRNILEETGFKDIRVYDKKDFGAFDHAGNLIVSCRKS